MIVLFYNPPIYLAFDTYLFPLHLVLITHLTYNFYMHPAILLDRDGVIIENRSNYVRSWSDVEIFPQALQGLALVKQSPYKIVIVTNQSAVGRGLVNLEAVHQINDRLLAEITASGGRVDSFFICPHAPQDNCSCRKPMPGLLLQAAHALSLDLSRSIMIGDALTDLQAGAAAGVQRLALVKTGRGADQAPLISLQQRKQISIFENLLAVLENLVQSAE
jgi:D-glycero-D-manno-heptose 1,7-bisphosphate phosphatase